MFKKTLVLALLLAGPALATDFTKPILDFKGNVMPNCPQAKPDCTDIVHLSDVAITALQATYPDEKDLSATEKVKRYALALKISNAKSDLHLEAEDIALLKTLIAKAYGPLIIGRAYELLDPK